MNFYYHDLFSKKKLSDIVHGYLQQIALWQFYKVFQAITNRSSLLALVTSELGGGMKVVSSIPVSDNSFGIFPCEFAGRRDFVGRPNMQGAWAPDLLAGA